MMTQDHMSSAIAHISGGRACPRLRGTVRFLPRQGGTLVVAEICGLPGSNTGFFALHIHEGSDCQGNGFPNTGGHYDPDQTAHPKHAGDLPPLLSDNGKAYSQVLTGRFRVSDIVGKTVVVHAGTDDFFTQPSGNAGKKIGCGVVRWA